MITLQVYVTAGCWSCEETERIVEEMRLRFPDVHIELLDTRVVAVPSHVFAVPTYVLNERIISLGNPTRAALARQLAAARLTSAA